MWRSRCGSEVRSPRGCCSTSSTGAATARSTSSCRRGWWCARAPGRRGGSELSRPDRDRSPSCRRPDCGAEHSTRVTVDSRRRRPADRSTMQAGPGHPGGPARPPSTSLEDLPWPASRSTLPRARTRVPRTPPSTPSTSTSPTASSSSSSARRAAASPPPCGCSPGWRRSPAAAILIGDKDVTHLPPKDRDIAMVFQNYALYPHMTVADNMGFALKIAGMGKDEIRKRVEEAAKILDLDELPRPQAQGPLRRPAPARRDGPRDRPQPAGLPDGRAAVEPRRQAARADPHPDRGAAAAARHDHRLRHPRPGRGDDDGRPRRGAQGRRCSSRSTPRATSTTSPTTSSSPASSARPR